LYGDLDSVHLHHLEGVLFNDGLQFTNILTQYCPDGQHKFGLEAAPVFPIVGNWVPGGGCLSPRPGRAGTLRLRCGIDTPQMRLHKGRNTACPTGIYLTERPVCQTGLSLAERTACPPGLNQEYGIPPSSILKGLLLGIVLIHVQRWACSPRSPFVSLGGQGIPPWLPRCALGRQLRNRWYNAALRCIRGAVDTGKH
jgi:hypothetical protein